jgi:hypothetical protein
MKFFRILNGLFVKKNNKGNKPCNLNYNQVAELSVFEKYMF